MKRRISAGLLCLTVVAGAAWLGRSGWGQKQEPAGWREVAPGVFASPGWPKSYAVVDGDKALLIDAAHDFSGLKALGVTSVEQVLLTHHHRDSAAYAKTFLDQAVPVR